MSRDTPRTPATGFLVHHGHGCPTCTRAAEQIERLRERDAEWKRRAEGVLLTSRPDPTIATNEKHRLALAEMLRDSLTNP